MSEYAMCKQFKLRLEDAQKYSLMPKNVLWFHVPNGQRRAGKAGIITAMRDKRIGSMAGAADYVVIWRDPPGGGETIAHVGFLEAKTSKGKASEKQREFAARAQAVGARYSLFTSPDEGLNILRSWGIPIRGGA